jgi:hypothetical protein
MGTFTCVRRNKDTRGTSGSVATLNAEWMALKRSTAWSSVEIQSKSLVINVARSAREPAAQRTAKRGTRASSLVSPSGGYSSSAIESSQRTTTASARQPNACHFESVRALSSNCLQSYREGVHHRSIDDTCTACMNHLWGVFDAVIDWSSESGQSEEDRCICTETKRMPL